MSLIYLLDTNVCIQYLNGRSSRIKEKFRETDFKTIAVCSVVKAELFYGAKRSNNFERTLQRQQNFLNNFVSLPFDDQSAIIYGDIRARLSELGTPIGSNDIQIAAIAIVNNLILVTHNTREFSRVNDLQLEDWEG
ncbi:MAG: type II toxin-antitoxin system VapC family toxin [Cyanobacteria bacterium P01_H01_bin.35]